MTELHKKAECYYVLNIKNSELVEDITQKGLSEIIHYKSLFTIEHFAQYDTLAQAKKARREKGGIILKGVKP